MQARPMPSFGVCIRHVSTFIMPPPRDLTFDLEVGVGVACDLGYPCAKFRLPRPFGFRVRADVRATSDGQTDDGRA